MIIAQKYYNVARSICRACTAEHVSVQTVVLTIDAAEYDELRKLVGEYPSVKYADGVLSIFNVRFMRALPKKKGA